MEINCAHAVMLAEQAIIQPDEAAVILRALNVVRAHPDRIERHQQQEDLYLMVEAAIIEEAGSVGGLLHIGRSRNDITATMTRMVARTAVDDVRQDLLALIRDLVALAGVHVDTIMPGYTHLRPAQPTTFGHYLTGIASALARDCDRLEQARRRVNECPMGAAAFAGTSFPVNRGRTAELLGFDRPMPHTLDAVASRDYVLELLGDLSTLATTQGRLAQDLYIWSSTEFGFVTLGAGVTGISSIMPQKRNPVVLERCRAKVAHVIAALADAHLATKGTGFTHSQDISIDSVAPLWTAVEEVRGMLAVLRAVVTSLAVDTDRMTARSPEGFALATEVADELVRTRGVPFRTAHTIVSRAVDRAAAAPSVPFSAHVSEAAREVTGSSLDVPDEELGMWLNAVRSVRQKRGGGTPAPQEVRKVLSDLEAWGRQAAQTVLTDVNGIRTTSNGLDETVRRLRGGE
jgi:argininosuccinate lyase